MWVVRSQRESKGSKGIMNLFLVTTDHSIEGVVVVLVDDWVTLFAIKS